MLYSIEDKTLTTLGDYIREKTPEFVYVDTPISSPEEFVMDTRELEVSQTTSSYKYYLVPIDLEQLFGDRYELANRYYVEVDYEIVNEGYEKPQYGLGISWLYSNNPTDTVYQNTFWVSDTLSLPLVGSTNNIMGLQKNYVPFLSVRIGKNMDIPCRFKAKIWPYTIDIQSIIEVNHKEKYTPLEMIESIKNNFMYKEPWIITNGAETFMGKTGAKVIELLGDKIITRNLGSAFRMFGNCPISEVPFELNFATSSTLTENNISNMFYQSDLIVPPKFNNVVVGDCASLFASMRYLREFPEGYFDNWDFSKLHKAKGTKNQMFSGCSSLRKIPQTFLDEMWMSDSTTNANVVPYYQLFANCYSLDEIIDLNIAENAESTVESSNLYMLATNCARLKNFTFKKNPDGTPKIIRWKSLTLDLSTVGSNNTTSAINGILDYNSGITADKRVIDDATYQALKNDPDWFSSIVNYSRYNHDSAVRTIDSLPDCSASGGTNTITFKGSAGAKTDGGAINTMTEEEIAVATAKGWTVSFV